MADLYNSDPHQLASLLDVESVASDVSNAWLPEELASILRHQLAVPLADDMGDRVLSLDRELESAGKYHGLASQTYGRLVREPDPPIEALHLVKQFAKSGRAQRGALLPPEVATVLYYISIIVAQDRCDARITSLGDATVAEGRRWMLAQPWISGEIKAMISGGEPRTTEGRTPPAKPLQE